MAGSDPQALRPARRRFIALHKVDDPRFLTGKLLLAMPGMGDPRFEKAVIVVCAHDEQGAIGVGIGHERPGVTFRTLLRQLDIEPGEAPDGPVHHGGPVEPGRGFVLHSLDWSGQDTIQVDQLCGLTGTIDILKAIAAGKGPGKWVAALGYAGWAGGQIEDEMTRHGWFTAGGEQEILFKTPTDKRWKAAYHREGIDPALLVGESGAA